MKSQKKKIDLIIFDFDGTLVDSRRDIITSVNMMLDSFGLPSRSPSEISGFIGKGVQQLIVDSLGEKNLSKVQGVIKVYKDIYKEHMFDTTLPYPGVGGILEYFSRKKMAIVSNKSVEFIQAGLEKFSIAKYFCKVSGGDSEKCRKPSALPLLNLMKELNVEPQRTVMVGDSDLDVQSGKDAGALTCGVTYGIGKKEDIVAARPDFLIDSIRELKDILE